MKKRIIVIVSLLAMKTFAAHPVDVYGTTEKEANNILQLYEKKISEVMDFLTVNSSDRKIKNNQKSKQFAEMLLKRDALIIDIKKRYHFIFVDFSTIGYWRGKNYFTTIEVVRRDSPQRMRFLSTQNVHNIPRKAKNHLADSIDTMIKYYDIIFQLKYNEVDFKKRYDCLSYHCSVAFHNPNLKSYLKIFNIAARKEKTFILSVLKNDPDNERRAAAIFLIAHLTNPREIIALLLPYVTDKNEQVRNNAMLTIGTTMSKAKIYHIDITPFIAYLDSPYDTDRNKALNILEQSAKSNDLKKIIIQQSGVQLIKLLQLKQPNNHNPAYSILKELSGQDFGEYNIAAWKKWLAALKN